MCGCADVGGEGGGGEEAKSAEGLREKTRKGRVDVRGGGEQTLRAAEGGREKSSLPSYPTPSPDAVIIREMARNASRIEYEQVVLPYQ